MIPYKRVPVWTNRQRVETLVKFQEAIVAYFSNTEYSDFGHGVNENAAARKARTAINLKTATVKGILQATSGIPTIHYVPPPIIGGPEGNIEPFDNIYHLVRYQIGPDVLIDTIEEAIGVYNDDLTNSIVRTINPFYWLGWLLDYIASIPFIALGRLGFDQTRIEQSGLGRFIKGVFSLLTAFSIFLGILEKLGRLNDFLTLIKPWLP